MPPTLRRSLTGLAALAVVTGGSACTSTSDSEGAAAGGTVQVTAGDDSCELSDTDLEAGLHTFEVTNKGSQVTEFYVYADGDRIMQEVENIGPGLTRELRVELPAGTYEGTCKPGMVGAGIRTTFTVTGEAGTSLSGRHELETAERSYRRYVQSQSRSLLHRTRLFVHAIKAGELAEAKRL